MGKEWVMLGRGIYGRRLGRLGWVLRRYCWFSGRGRYSCGVVWKMSEVWEVA
jgi:hypothetical protein